MRSAAFNGRRALSLAALAGVELVFGATPNARADIKDYEFRLVEKEAKAGKAIVAVRLIQKIDGKPIPDAVIFATRLDMAPEGMESMKGAIEPAPNGEPGVYRFKVDLAMEGKWRLSLAAKVQGEIGTVENRLIFDATP
ncbi:FixH family protein [Methylosinus sp. LW3]|uniref:FixH family protein n=1 Tax=Methylosinus sp. LW3 TaxID=107635 RepID=UPI0004654959|nr:FixH family protein [Methylosinus sp. LW3]